MNKLLKMKFREPNCEYQLRTTSSRTGWPYRAIMDRSTLEERDWKLTSTPIPRKLDVVDLDVVLKT